MPRKVLQHLQACKPVRLRFPDNCKPFPAEEPGKHAVSLHQPSVKKAVMYFSEATGRAALFENCRFTVK